MVEIILAVLVFFPFAAGLIVYAIGTRKEKQPVGEGSSCDSKKGLNRAAEIVAVCSVAAEFVLVVFMAAFCYIQSRTMELSFNNSVETGLQILFSVPEICGFGFHFCMDGFRLIYAGVAAFMWMMTTILSGEYFRHHENVGRFYLFLLMTLGATMGVFLSADLYTTFIFFEIMSFTSYVWVAQEENRPSLQAAATYLAVAVIGGLVMLMGIFLLYYHLGTVTISELSGAAAAFADKRILYIAGGCMLFGFGAKAGSFPLHIWLPKAHPVAPAPASALLSGILTKTGIYGTLILSCQLFVHDAAWGKVVLGLGVITMFGGALLAVFSVDLKRTLACSSMSQIGFIMVGIGMQGLLGEENALAVHGTLLHMVNHSLIKLVLFMAAGVIFMNTHALDLNQIRGYGRKKPLLAGIFLTGALTIGGIPLFGGYVSKTLLHEAIVEFGGGGIMKAVEWIFLFSGGLTVAYMTKLFVAIFVEKNPDGELQKQYDGQKKYMNNASGFALTGSALVLLVWGLFPHEIMDKVAELGQSFMNLREFGHRVSYFSLSNLQGALISVCIGAAVYLLFIRNVLLKKQEGSGAVYINAWPNWLDLENLLYKPLLLTILPTLFGVLCRTLDSFTDTMAVLLRKTLYRDSPLPHERPEGNLFTAMVGRIINGFEVLGNHTWNKKHPNQRDYRHLLALKSDEFKESNRIIGGSLSFGLLLFGVGLALTLVYLICW